MCVLSVVVVRLTDGGDKDSGIRSFRSPYTHSVKSKRTNVIIIDKNSVRFVRQKKRIQGFDDRVGFVGLVADTWVWHHARVNVVSKSSVELVNGCKNVA